MLVRHGLIHGQKVWVKVWPSAELRSAAKSLGLLYA